MTLQIVPVSGPADKGPEHVPESSVVPIQAAPKAGPPKVLQGAIPSGHIPKPVILPDYIAYVSLKMNCCWIMSDMLLLYFQFSVTRVSLLYGRPTTVWSVVFCFLSAVSTQQSGPMRSGTSTELCLMTSMRSTKSSTQRCSIPSRSSMRWTPWCAACPNTLPAKWWLLHASPAFWLCLSLHSRQNDLSARANCSWTKAILISSTHLCIHCVGIQLLYS